MFTNHSKIKQGILKKMKNTQNISDKDKTQLTKGNEERIKKHGIGLIFTREETLESKPSIPGGKNQMINVYSMTCKKQIRGCKYRRTTKEED